MGPHAFPVAASSSESSAVVAPPVIAPAAGYNTWLTRMVPYKNVPALLGYYAAFASAFVPGKYGIGSVVVAALAVVCGIIGVVMAKAEPWRRGKVHGYVAIVLGLVMVVLWATIVVFVTRAIADLQSTAV